MKKLLLILGELSINFLGAHATGICDSTKILLSTSGHNTSDLLGCDGYAVAGASGGTAPYAYSWSQGSFTDMASGLCMGTYSVTVTDANGCSSNGHVVIQNGDTTNQCMTLHATSSNADSGKCDGTASVSVGGGHAPYMYSWSNGHTTPSLTGLCAGSYTATVTDSGGCVKTATVSIANSGSACAFSTLKIVVTGHNTSDSLSCNGYSYVTASGGVTPYTYLWSDSSTFSDIGKMCAGTYWVVVTDAQGCTRMEHVVIGQGTTDPCANTSLIGTTSVTMADSAKCNGTASVTVSGGMAPYSYQWSNGGSTTSVSGLCPGTYTVYVHDASGCTKTTIAIITSSGSGPCANTVLNIKLSVANSTDTINCNGSIIASIGEGHGPYTYSWSNGSKSYANTALCAGVYTVNVTDSLGCKASSYAKVEQVAANPCSSLSVTVSGTSFITNCDGSAKAIVSGGAAPYKYYWSNYYNTSSISNLCPGEYGVKVVDANGCSGHSSIMIMPDSGATNKYPLKVYVSTKDASSANTCDGVASVHLAGGTPPYTYLYSNGATNAETTGLCPGYYSVVISDAGKKTDSLHFIIASPSVVYQDTTIKSTYSDSTVVATIVNDAFKSCVLDYTQVDSVLISTFEAISKDSLKVTWKVYVKGTGTVVVQVYGISAAGVYTLILQLYCDGNGKTSGATGFLKAIDQVYVAPSLVTGISKVTSSGTNVYPVPFTSLIYINLEGSNTHNISVSDLLGKQVYASILTGKGVQSLDLGYLPTGCYILKIESASGVEYRKITKE